MKTTKIFSVRSSPDPPIFKKFAIRSSPDPAKIGFSPDPVRSSPIQSCPCSSLVYSIITVTMKSCAIWISNPVLLKEFFKSFFGFGVSFVFFAALKSIAHDKFTSK